MYGIEYLPLWFVIVISHSHCHFSFSLSFLIVIVISHNHNRDYNHTNLFWQIFMIYTDNRLNKFVDTIFYFFEIQA